MAKTLTYEVMDPLSYRARQSRAPTATAACPVAGGFQEKAALCQRQINYEEEHLHATVCGIGAGRTYVFVRGPAHSEVRDDRKREKRAGEHIPCSSAEWGNSAAGARHLQAIDRNQHDRLGGQRNGGFRGDGETFSRCRFSGK